MNVSILAFGVVRDLVGSDTIEIAIENDTSVDELLGLVKDRYPGLSKLKSLVVALNASYANGDEVIGENDEVVLIPPVAGG